MSQYIASNSKSLLVIITVFAMAGATLLLDLPAQSPAPPLAFEVVSVKVSKSTDPRDMALQFLPSGRFVARGIPIPLLVLEAYNNPPRLIPSPEFQKLDMSAIERQRYDIEAVAAQGAISSAVTG